MTSPLAEQVYAFLRQIPHGKVATYGQIATHLGNRHLARAVGNILHRNPDPDSIPCYKVVSASGRLSSHYAYGGLPAQRERLEADGILVKNDRVDLTKYQYRPEIP